MTASRWFPFALFAVGAVLVLGGATRQHAVPLAAPLDEAVPRSLLGAEGVDIPISEAEQRVAGMDEFVLREYTAAGLLPYSVYVGYYEQQRQGHTIHSPRNCLPGGGWEPLTQGQVGVTTASGTAPVNRYVIANGAARALVLYWYQGRGRVAASEYGVKWDLLRDQALHGRSDEALVRIIVGFDEGQEEVAEQRAVAVAQQLIPRLEAALPS